MQIGIACVFSLNMRLATLWSMRDNCLHSFGWPFGQINSKQFRMAECIIDAPRDINQQIANCDYKWFKPIRGVPQTCIPDQRRNRNRYTRICGNDVPGECKCWRCPLIQYEFDTHAPRCGHEWNLATVTLELPLR